MTDTGNSLSAENRKINESKTLRQTNIELFQTMLGYLG